MTDELNKVPDGVLATVALASEPAPEPKVEDTPSPTVLPVDPDYAEPFTYEKFAEMAASQARSVDELTSKMDLETAKLALEQVTLIKFLLARVRVLQLALRPFATTGMVFSNARMCLIANGDGKDPAGGTWVSNPPEGITLQPNEGLFYNATDTYGRQATHDHMAETLVKLQEANKLQAEKTAHLEAGGKIH